METVDENCSCQATRISQTQVNYHDLSECYQDKKSDETNYIKIASHPTNRRFLYSIWRIPFSMHS
uniref:Uncharacterized protein n=1 Tax=Rhizophora mucronata TaxID=61149 RepID=A0A2P2QNF9_RHIMU